MSSPSTTETVRTVQRGDDTTITYTVTGPDDGPTWVFIHGWGCRRTDFAALVAHLPAGDRTVSVDLPGHGDSRSSREVWTMEELARDVAAVLAAEGVRQCTVVGHSLGGAVAVELARLEPDVVLGIVGIDSFHYLGLYPMVDEPGIRALIAGFEADFPAAVRGLVAMGSVPETDPAFGEEIFQKMSSVPPRVGIPVLEEMLRWDMDTAIAAVPQPLTTLAVRGLLDPAAVERYSGRITFTVTDLGSHHFLVEAPEQTAQLLVGARH